MTLRGARKRTTQLVQVLLGNRALLTTRVVREVVSFMDATQPRHWLAPMLLVAWAILGRVQSEILPLELGSEADAVMLAPRRHSAVWQDAARTLWIRLKKRKHRPQGSLLSAACSCAENSAFCPACRVMTWARENHVQPGFPLWPGVSAAVSLSALHRVLTLLGLVAPTTYTWKAVRAGRATELATTPGVSLAEVMKQGEWSSAAVLAYLRPEDVHTQAFVAHALEASDAED